MEDFDLRKYLAEGKLLKEELTWYVEDENEDVSFQNYKYIKEVGKKIMKIHPDISSEDLYKIIIMTGEQYSRDEEWHGDSIPSGNFVKAAVEIYTTDILAEGKLLKEVRGPLKMELNIKKGEGIDIDMIRDDYGFDYNVDEVPVEDLFDENGFALRDMVIVYDSRDDMYLMDTEDMPKYH